MTGGGEDFISFQGATHPIRAVNRPNDPGQGVPLQALPDDLPRTPRLVATANSTRPCCGRECQPSKSDETKPPRACVEGTALYDGEGLGHLGEQLGHVSGVFDGAVLRPVEAEAFHVSRFSNRFGS